MHPELDWFNRLSATLDIELDQPPEPLAPNLLNRKALPDAKIRSLSLDAQVYLAEPHEFRPLTEEELDRIAFPEPRIRFADGVDAVAPNGVAFTTRDLLRAIEDAERRTRGSSEWFGGIDVHHVFFEGLRPAGDGTWRVRWGS